MTAFNDFRVDQRTVRGQLTCLPTYECQMIGYAGYANATDWFALRNPVGSGKRLSPRWFGALANQTAGAVTEWFFYRRSAFNTGGAPTFGTPVSFDSADAAPVGLPLTYGSAPVIVDSGAPMLYRVPFAIAAAAPANPSNVNLASTGLFFATAPVVDFLDMFHINPGEELVINNNGVSFGAGFSAIGQCQWTESPL